MIQPVNLKGNQSWIFIGRTDAEAEAPILWPPDAKSWLIRKDPDAGKDWRQEKGTAEDEMVGWYHWLDGYELEWAPGASDGQGSLVCYSPWGCRVRHNWATELNWKAREKVYRKKHWNQKLDFSWAPVLSSLRWTSWSPVKASWVRGKPRSWDMRALTWPDYLWVAVGPFPCSHAMGASQVLPPPCGLSSLELVLGQWHPINISSTHSSHSFPAECFCPSLLSVSQTHISGPQLPCSTTLGKSLWLLVNRNLLLCKVKKMMPGTAPVVQRLRLQVPSAGDLGPIPGQGIRSSIPQLKIQHHS